MMAMACIHGWGSRPSKNRSSALVAASWFESADDAFVDLASWDCTIITCLLYESDMAITARAARFQQFLAAFELCGHQEVDEVAQRQVLAVQGRAHGLALARHLEIAGPPSFASSRILSFRRARTMACPSILPRKAMSGATLDAPRELHSMPSPGRPTRGCPAGPRRGRRPASPAGVACGPHRPVERGAVEPLAERRSGPGPRPGTRGAGTRRWIRSLQPARGSARHPGSRGLRTAARPGAGRALRVPRADPGLARGVDTPTGLDQVAERGDGLRVDLVLGGEGGEEDQGGEKAAHGDSVSVRESDILPP